MTGKPSNLAKGVEDLGREGHVGHSRLALERVWTVGHFCHSAGTPGHPTARMSMLTLKQPEQGLSEHKPETLLGALRLFQGSKL